MSFARGDLVQVIHYRSPFRGQVGVVMGACDCFTAALSQSLIGRRIYRVAIDGGQCFLEHHLRKLGERPPAAADSIDTTVERPCAVPA